MTVTDIVRRLNEACTGGRKCQCTYRVAAQEMERLQSLCIRAYNLAGELAVHVGDRPALQSIADDLNAIREQINWVRK